VLVSRTASPNLTLIMRKIKALVAGSGGIAAIASQFAREYGVPAVVGANGVTEAIEAGDIVRVDGTKGVIEVTRRSSHIPHVKVL
jgi:phosphohistidine swiveling domain-containing protein